MFSVSSLKRDIPASLVVFFVALPLCLGIALASGAPLFAGLIAGIVGGIVVGSISKAPIGVSGPAAGLTVIVLTAIETLGSYQYFLLAVFLAGLIQIGLGLLRAGVLGYFFPSSVINGMLTGIGIIIILKQIPYAFGFLTPSDSNMLPFSNDGSGTIAALFDILNFVHPGVMLISLVSVVLLIVWERPWVKQNKLLGGLPGPVVAVVVAVILQLGFSGLEVLALTPDYLVSVPVAGSVAEFVGLFTLPDFSQLTNPAIWTVAFTLAIVASIETLLCVEAIDKLDPQKRTTPTNRELIAQGVGNSVSGLIGGLPLTQVIVRSSANLQARAASKLSAILHGFLLLICIAAVPTLLNKIPLGVLAAVLIVTGYKLAKPKLFKAMWSHGLEQFLPFVITVAGVVFTDLLTGVALGMAAAIIMLLQRNYLNSHFLHIKESATAEGRTIITMRLAEEVTFLNKGAIKKQFDNVPNGSVVIIDKSPCVFINHDVQEYLQEFAATAAERDISVEFIENEAPINQPQLSAA
jgi:MFS superfamily sulfate permease-like transporter